MKHFAVLSAVCRKCEEHGEVTGFSLEVELTHPGALLGVKLRCPRCGTPWIWYKRAATSAAGAR
jgi:hypothetical protein